MKHKIISGIDRNELVQIKVLQDESGGLIRWEHPDEFEFEGQMYDVVYKQFKGDTSIYWCWWDHKETRLNRELDTLVAGILGNDTQRKEKNKNLVDFIKKLYCESFSYYHIKTTEIRVIYQIFPEKVFTICHRPPVPPPRIG